MRAEQKPVTGYWEANARWLHPAAATLMVLAPSFYAAAGVFELPFVVPAWLTTFTLVVGGVATGIGARLTDTVSARAVSLLAPLLVLGYLLARFV